jgi:hypothetical protein
VLYQPGYGDVRELGTGILSDLASRLRRDDRQDKISWMCVMLGVPRSSFYVHASGRGTAYHLWTFVPSVRLTVCRVACAPGPSPDRFMARMVRVVTTDDLGSPDAETVSFGLDGVSHEIDLAQPNRTRLAETVAPFIAAGRGVGRSGRRSTGRPAAGRADRAAVRAWARQAGLAVSERGRISAEVSGRTRPPTSRGWSVRADRGLGED